MGIIDKTVGLSAFGAGALGGAFALNAAVPAVGTGLSASGGVFPLDGLTMPVVDLPSIVSTLATIDPVVMGVGGAFLMLVGTWIMKSGSQPKPAQPQMG